MKPTLHSFIGGQELRLRPELADVPMLENVLEQVRRLIDVGEKLVEEYADEPRLCAEHERAVLDLKRVEASIVVAMRRNAASYAKRLRTLARIEGVGSDPVPFDGDAVRAGRGAA